MLVNRLDSFVTAMSDSHLITVGILVEKQFKFQRIPCGIKVDNSVSGPNTKY